MKEKNIDLRVIKTRKALVSSLYELLCEKSLNEITVTELCEKAAVRKATFYKHFGDKEELLVYMIRQLQDKAKEGHQTSQDDSHSYRYYTEVFGYLLDFLDHNEVFVKSVLNSNASAVIIRLLLEEIEEDIRICLKHEKDPDLRNANAFLATAYAGAIVNCGKWWILQENRPKKTYIMDVFSSRILCK